ncbi:PaaI family thioesterase [Sphingomonas sp. BAUL-RG-20F-R05-02]|uniref:PaaI family thioesterase n=1 Tax=Sphingomonas sp. BAUL-RG-20F-R05-02 TaxID=2914830 RepID=UPI001F5833EA|nr:hotdog domain-containing protein [Sphingomonas sp. BAUL-RG-20F-R05-02]
MAPLTVTGDTSRAGARCPSSWQGGPGIAHGGWVAAVLDDFAGRTMTGTETFVVTGTLNVTYLRPTPVEEDLVLTGTRHPDGERRWRVTAHLHLAVAPDAPLAELVAMMIEPRPGHYQRHVERMTAMRGAAD